MKTRERGNAESKTRENWPGMFWGPPEVDSGGTADCCAGVSAMCDCSSMMGRCPAMCRWFPLLPLILGIVLLGLGYYLDASITRFLWMFAAGFMALMGAAGLILAGGMRKMWGRTR